MKNFKDKVAVVTGAGSGMGRHLAIQLSQAGAHLALNDYNPDTLRETEQLVQSSGVQVMTSVFDTSKKDAVYQFADEVKSKFGHVDIVINNAGVGLGKVNGMDIKYQDFEWVMDINFWGMVYGTKAFIPLLKDRPEASIVHLSSLFGLVGIPYQTAYCASKFAIRGFSESLRAEMMVEAPHIVITSVHPGGINTSIAQNSKLPLGGDPGEHRKANKQFQKLLKMPPERAAEIILNGIKKKKTRVLVGRDATSFDRIARWFPNFYSKIVVKAALKQLEKEKMRKQAKNGG